MDNTLQWAVSCSRCDSSANVHCNTCRVDLCPECKENHQSVEDTKHHMIVSYSERLQTIPKECLQHEGNFLVAWCDTCGHCVCIRCMTSPDHKMHAFVDFDVKVKQKKISMQADYEEINTLLSDMKISSANLDKRAKALDKSFEGIKFDIIAQAETICSHVNRIKSKALQQLQDNKESCYEDLRGQKLKVNEKLNLLQSDVDIYDGILRSNDAMNILDFDQTPKQQDDVSVPKFSEITIPVFIKGEVDVDQLDAMLGGFVLRRSKSSIQMERKRNLHLTAPV